MMNKKFLENGILSVEDLEKVSGGNMAQTSEDSKLLYAYSLVDDYHGILHMDFHWKSDSAAVDAGWSKAGITSVTKVGCRASKGRNGNQYFINGKEITRNEAINHLKANFQQVRAMP